MPVRTLVVWCPDWPVVAAGRAHGYADDAAIAVIDKGCVHACSQAARDSGVRRGLRTREAQARCPELVVVPHDVVVDARAFEPVVATVEALAPGVEIIRPGVCCVAVAGPERYFGGEGAVVAALSKRLAADGVVCQLGIADGPFAAEQAARRGVIVPPGQTAEWLAPLPIDLLDLPELVSLLRRLGLRTLGAFAALPDGRVLARFGVDGARAHRLAGGRDDRLLATRRPPPELTVELDLEPPVDRVDTVAFSARGSAQRFIDQLAHRQLVCTGLFVEIESANGEVSQRCWRHPRWFSSTDVVDRVRWQLSGEANGPVDGGDASAPLLTAGVTRLALIPEEVDRTGAHVDGLWGEQAPTEEVYRAVSRVQSMLGHGAVRTAIPSGGRDPAEQVTLVPHGDAVPAQRSPASPWPGRLPAPSPATVLPTATPVEVVDALGHPVGIDDRAMLTAAPARLVDGGRDFSLTSRSAPWPVEERWWDASAARRYVRMQVVLDDGRALLVTYEHGRWWVAAVYD